MTTQLMSSDAAWAVEEFAAVALNDSRLNRRCQVWASVLEHQPTMLLNQACEDWASTKAAYRLMDNPKVSRSSLLRPHGQLTIERLSVHAVVLTVQDTTFLNFTTHQQTAGLGEIGPKAQHQRGFGPHTTLALTPHGLPLGILTQTVFTRPIGAPLHTASARHATVTIRFCRVTLKPPTRPLPSQMPPVTLTAILVREEHPPATIDEPIEWLLLTNTAVSTFAGAVRVVGWYCGRWQIEVYHKILKSGCQVEDSRLQTAACLQNYLALMAFIAWRLHRLTYINRTDPNQPCTVVLTTPEWQALYLRIHKTSAFPQETAHGASSDSLDRSTGWFLRP